MTTSGHNWLHELSLVNETDHSVNNSAIIPKYEMHQNRRANGSKNKRKEKRTERNGIWRQELETIPTKTHKRNCKKEQDKGRGEKQFQKSDNEK